MTYPTLQEVKKHFRSVKEVRCLSNNIIIDVSGISNFDYDKSKKEWTSVGGSIVFWKDSQYATIYASKKTKKCQCENCNCKEKNKLVKRNQTKTK